jgi:hypothetical protein
MNWMNNAGWVRDRYTGPGGGMYTGPGGGMYTGPGGGAYTGPGGGAYTGPGGGAYTGPGGGLYTGPWRRGLHRTWWRPLHRTRRRGLHRTWWRPLHRTRGRGVQRPSNSSSSPHVAADSRPTAVLGSDRLLSGGRDHSPCLRSLSETRRERRLHPSGRQEAARLLDPGAREAVRGVRPGPFIPAPVRPKRGPAAGAHQMDSPARAS